MLKTLIAEPSVSCINAAHDQSNLGVLHHLANWLEDLGFGVDVQPLPGKPGKANLVAKTRERRGRAGVSPVTPIRCPATNRFGASIPSR